MHVTQSIKVNGVTDNALRLYLFPHSLTHHATAWFDRLPRNSINTFEQMAKMFLGKYFPPSMVTKLRNEITNFCERLDESLFEAWQRYKLSIDRCPNHNMLPVTQLDTFYNGLTLRHHDTINAAAGGTFMKRRPEECYNLIENMTAHHSDWDTSVQRRASHGQNPPPAYRASAYQAPGYQAPTNMTPLKNSNLELKNMFGQFMKMNTVSSSGSGTLPSNTVTNPKEDLNGITTRSGNVYQGPMIPTTSSLPQVVERETEVTKDTVPPTNNGSAKDVQSVVDFDADTRVPLILRRSFLKTRRALIDVYEGELSLRVGKEAVTFNLDQTTRYSDNYDAMSVNRIDLIDVACEEYSQEVLGFSMSGNPTPSMEPLVFNSSPTLTPFGDSDFLLEETDAFLAIDDEPISSEIDKSYYDSEGDILLIEEYLNDDTSSPPLPPQELKGDDKLPVIIAKDLKYEEKTALKKAVQHQRRASPKIHEVIKKEVLELLDAELIYPISDSPWMSPCTTCMMAIFHDMIKKTIEIFMDDFSVFGNSFETCLSHLDKMLKWCEDTNLCQNWEKSHFMVKEGIVLGHKISKNGIKVDKAKVNVIAKLHPPTTVKGIHSFLGHAGFYRRFIQDFSKIARSMTRLLEKDTSFFFSKECIEAFQTLKKKLIEAPILVAPD
nr:reverse transcriptase domain-containing protein [Tanacetum cinerariifolium]